MLVSATLGGDDRYKLILARDGEEALNLAKRDLQDLIFLDIIPNPSDGTIKGLQQHNQVRALIGWEWMDEAI